MEVEFRSETCITPEKQFQNAISFLLLPIACLAAAVERKLAMQTQDQTNLRQNSIQYVSTALEPYCYVDFEDLELTVDFLCVKNFFSIRR